jgi:ribosomal protein S19
MQNLIKFTKSKKVGEKIFKKFFTKNSIIPKLSGKIYITVHCGKYWRTFFNLKLHCGRKLGMFIFTRKNYQYLPKKKLK